MSHDREDSAGTDGEYTGVSSSQIAAEKPRIPHSLSTTVTNRIPSSSSTLRLDVGDAATGNSDSGGGGGGGGGCSAGAFAALHDTQASASGRQAAQQPPLVDWSGRYAGDKGDRRLGSSPAPCLNWLPAWVRRRLLGSSTLFVAMNSSVAARMSGSGVALWVILAVVFVVLLFFHGPSASSFFASTAPRDARGGGDADADAAGSAAAAFPSMRSAEFETFEGLLFCGHLVADTDSVAAAVAAADFFSGAPAMSAESAEELNPETKLVLKRFRQKAPQFVGKMKSRDTCIVDFNQKSQLPPAVAEERIKCIIDHHALRPGAVELAAPIHVHIRPVGSTATVIAWLYFDQRRAVPQNVAGLLLSGILSDTLNLKGPTTTERDRVAVEYLAPAAGVSDVTAWAKEMFAAKSQLEGLTPKQVAALDFKRFEVGGKTFGFGVVETVTPDAVLGRKREYLDAIGELKRERELDYIFVGVVDILEFQTHLLLSDEDDRVVAERAFATHDDDYDAGVLFIGSRVSRKKEFIPPVQRYLEKMAS